MKDKVISAMKIAVGAKRIASTALSPVATARDIVRQFLISAAVKGIVKVAGNSLPEEKVNAIFDWQKDVVLDVPVGHNMLSWFRDPEMIESAKTTLNELLQVPLMAYGVTPAQIQAELTETHVLRLTVTLKIHKNSDLN